MKKTGFTTKALHTNFAKKDPHNALQMPVYGTVAYEFDSAEQIMANFKGEYQAHVYSRTSNPTVEYFELKLRELTQSHAVLAVSSGMAAISNTILSCVKSGDNIIAGKHLFGHTFALFDTTLPEFGIETRFSELKSEAAIEALIDSNTRAIYFETVTNPQLEIADINMLSKVCKKHGILLIADSTLTPPNVLSAGEFGVNIEVISTTKYISGGGTTFGGAIIDYGNFDWNKNPNFSAYTSKFRENAFIAKLRKNIYRHTGGTMTAQTALLQIQGLDILELRVEKCYQNCMMLGEFLNAHPKVKKVDYPGLESSPQYQLASKYFHGIPGTIMAFDLETQEQCFAFMNALKLIKRATNLNDNKSLIIHPYSTIYQEFTEEEREDMKIRSSMMRLSVGIENVEDLMEDINAALELI